jgi:hypothetical protein
VEKSRLEKSKIQIKNEEKMTMNKAEKHKSKRVSYSADPLLTNPLNSSAKLQISAT